MRIDVPGEIGKSLILNQRLVDSAATGVPGAYRALRALLRSEVLQQVSRAAGHRARMIRAVDFPPKGLCDLCGQPIQTHQAMVVRRARIQHADCARRAKPDREIPLS